MNKMIDPVELDFLLRFPAVPNVTSPVDFLSNNSWGGIKALSAMDQFRNLDRDIEVKCLHCMCMYCMMAKQLLPLSIILLILCYAGFGQEVEEVCGQ